MIHTLIQILVFQALFLAVYDLFLKKETFFNWNRTYLLLTPIIVLVLPFISLNLIQQNVPEEYVIQLPAVILGNSVSEVGSSSLSWFSIFQGLWVIGIIISSILFLMKIKRILALKSSGIKKNINETKYIVLPETDSAFSFFNTIYLGENISEKNKASIIAHEKIHIKQKHSLDLLYFELLRIVFWFNPLVYMFQNRISLLHEYIADAAITKETDKKQYYQNLLSEVFQTEQISFVNTFFNQSLIKKRIVMLKKSKSKKAAQFKFLLLVPIVFSMLFYTACSDVPKAEDGQDIQQSESEIMNKIKEQEEAKIEQYRRAQGKENVVVQIDTIMGGEAITDVPYSVIDQVPTYPECSGDNETVKNCMSTKIAEFINSNFNTAIADNLNLTGRQRISVQFKIDKNGDIVDVRARAKNPELEAEAVRVVKMLPQMKPGEQRGEKVGVLYSLPIVFDVK